MVWANGDLYTGSFKNGMMHGKGVFVKFSTGNKYDGEYKKGKKDGHGIWYYNSENSKEKKMIEGNFFEGQMETVTLKKDISKPNEQTERSSFLINNLDMKDVSDSKSIDGKDSDRELNAHTIAKTES